MPAPKKQTTLSLEEALVEKAKRLGLNMSQITNEALRFIINTGNYQPLVIELSLVNMKIQQLETLRADIYQNIKQMDNMLGDLQVQKASITQLIMEAEKDTEMARLFQQLLELCKVHKFKPRAIWDDSEQIREGLSRLGVDYGFLDFTLYVKSMERTMK